MKKYRVHGIISASIFIGEYEAETEEEAIDAAEEDPKAEHCPSLCNQCAGEIDIGDIYEYSADEVAD